MAAVSIMDVNTPPDVEAGYPGGMRPGYDAGLGPGYVVAPYEETAELEFRVAQAIYDRMRRTDGQVGSLLRAITLPILANRFTLDHEGVAPAVRTLVETELGLNGDDGTTHSKVRRHGIVWKEHLRQVLLALPLGFMPFEKVWVVAPPNSDQAGVEGMPDQVVHLSVLSPRLPRTVEEIRVNRDGTLEGIIQAGIGWDVTGMGSGVNVIGGVGRSADAARVWIPADRLAFYCFEREGADYSGSSILRCSYKDWLVKEQLIRVDAQAGERNGMGLPVVTYTDQGSRAEALRIATEIRAGAAAGVAVADGAYKVELMGVSGQVRDVLPSIKYHDQAISGSALAMFLNLGHDAGARSLAQTFVDYFVMSLQAVCDWIAETTTEQVIRDLVELNFGPDEPCPVLVADEISAESKPTADAISALITAGLIHPTHDDEVEFRRRWGLPTLPAVTVAPQPPVDDSPEGVIDTVPPFQPHPPVDPRAQAAPDAPPVPPHPGVPTKVSRAETDPLLDQATALVERLAALRAAG